MKTKILFLLLLTLTATNVYSQEDEEKPDCICIASEIKTKICFEKCSKQKINSMTKSDLIEVLKKIDNDKAKDATFINYSLSAKKIKEVYKSDDYEVLISTELSPKELDAVYKLMEIDAAKQIRME